MNWRSRRSTDLGDPVGTVLLVALASLCLLGTGVALQRAVDDRDELDRIAADRASDVLAAELQASIAALNGADAIAADGAVSAEDFAAFTGDIVDTAVFTALAYSEPVDGEHRAAWEAATGLPLEEFGDPGELRPADERDGYVVVRLVEPSTETATRTLGLDLASDPTRRAAIEDAARSTGPVVMAPIALASTGAAGLFVAKSVVHDDRVVGYVTSGLSVDALAERLDPRIAGSLTIWLDDVELRHGSPDGATSTFAAGGREFVVRADDPTSLDLTLPLMGSVATVIVTAATMSSWRRDRRARRRHLATGQRNAALGSLAEELADAATSMDAAATVAGRALAIALADSAAVALVDVARPERLLVVGADGPIEEDALSAGDGAAVAEAIRTLTTLVLTGPDVRRACTSRDDAETDAETEAETGPTVVIAVPLLTDADTAGGALELAWSGPVSERRLEALREDASAIAEVAGRALERIIVREIIRGGVEQVGEIARALTAAHTPADVEGIVEGPHVTRLLDVAAVHLDAEELPEPDDQRTFPLPSSGPGGARLRIELATGQQWTPMRQALVRTVVELTDAAWRRARQHQQEHGVVERLQMALLAPPPPLSHLELAVRYQSAMDTIGIGGDWFSVIDHADATFLVIGDVTGHGPDAVALMSEVKTILRHLFSSGATIADALTVRITCSGSLSWWAVAGGRGRDSCSD